MKKSFTFRALCTLFVLLGLSIGSAWGEETVTRYVMQSYSSENKVYTVTDSASGVWTLSTNCSTSNQLPATWGASSSSDRGFCLSKPSNVTVVSSTSFTDVTKIVVEASSNLTNCTGTISVKIGETTIGSTITLTKTNHQTCEFQSNTPLSGVITLTVNQSSNSVWIAGVEVTTNSTPAPSYTLGGLTISGQTTTYDIYDAFSFDGTATATYTEEEAEDVVVTNKVTIASMPDMTTPGSKNITVNYTEGETTVSATYTINVTDGQDITINDFINGAGTVKGYLTGVVSNIANTTYGNYTLTDEDGNSIYVYGTLTTARESKQFASMGIDVLDKIKIYAKEYEYYNNTTHEAKNVIFVEKLEYSKPTYSVYINSPINGTLEVSDGENLLTGGEQVEQTTILTITATPDDGYKLTKIDILDENGNNEYTESPVEWTMGASDIGISVTFEPIVYHTIIWSVNGNTTTIPASSVEDGKDITFPTEVDDINGKTFVGWIEASSYSDASVAPTFVKTATASENKTYYAVFANQIGGGEEVITLTCEKTTASQSYSEFTETDDHGYSWPMYAFIAKQTSNGVDYYYFQINKNSKGYHISSPTFANNVKKIEVIGWNTSSSNRTAYLCSNTENAQPDSGDLGSLEIAGNTKDASLTFTLNENVSFKQFNIYVSGALGFRQIIVTCDGVSLSNYTTNPPVTHTITTSANSNGFATFFNSNNVVLPANVDAYYYYIENDAIKSFKLVDGGDILPANIAVILFTGVENAGSYTLEETTTDAGWDATLINDNLLRGTDATEVVTAENNEVLYILSKGSKGVGFYQAYPDGNNSFTNSAHKAYLALPSTVAASYIPMITDGTSTTTAVENIEQTTTVKKFIQDGKLYIQTATGIYDATGRLVK